MYSALCEHALVAGVVLGVLVFGVTTVHGIWWWNAKFDVGGRAEDKGADEHLCVHRAAEVGGAGRVRVLGRGLWDGWVEETGRG